MATHTHTDRCIYLLHSNFAIVSLFLPPRTFFISTQKTFCSCNFIEQLAPPPSLMWMLALLYLFDRLALVDRHRPDSFILLPSLFLLYFIWVFDAAQGDGLKTNGPTCFTNTESWLTICKLCCKPELVNLYKAESWKVLFKMEIFTVLERHKPDPYSFPNYLRRSSLFWSKLSHRTCWNC